MLFRSSVLEKEQLSLAAMIAAGVKLNINRQTEETARKFRSFCRIHGYP